MALRALAVFFIGIVGLAGCSNIGDKVSLMQAAVLKSDENVTETSATHVSKRGKPIFQGLRPEFSAMAAEFIATFLLVIVGCGTAMGMPEKNDSAKILTISFAFSFTVCAMIYAIGHYSGGQINPAVTVGLVFTGRTTIAQGILDVVFQLLGAIAGSCFLRAIYSHEQDNTKNLGLNRINPKSGWSWIHVLAAEATMTFMLVFVVLETATNPMSFANAPMAPAAIGIVYFIAHSLLIPIDGCSVNPARSFAPAFVMQFNKYVPFIDQKRFEDGPSPFADQWVFWVGPVAGALVAAGLAAALMQ